eukprot:scaffold15975_cov27-Tisochrysis_lutea.AAC.2
MGSSAPGRWAGRVGRGDDGVLLASQQPARLLLSWGSVCCLNQGVGIGGLIGCHGLHNPD